MKEDMTLNMFWNMLIIRAEWNLSDFVPSLLTKGTDTRKYEA